MLFVLPRIILVEALDQNVDTIHNVLAPDTQINTLPLPPYTTPTAHAKHPNPAARAAVQSVTPSPNAPCLPRHWLQRHTPPLARHNTLSQ